MIKSLRTTTSMTPKPLKQIHTSPSDHQSLVQLPQPPSRGWEKRPRCCPYRSTSFDTSAHVLRFLFADAQAAFASSWGLHTDQYLSSDPAIHYFTTNRNPSTQWISPDLPPSLPPLLIDSTQAVEELLLPLLSGLDSLESRFAHHTHHALTIPALACATMLATHRSRRIDDESLLGRKSVGVGYKL